MKHDDVVIGDDLELHPLEPADVSERYVAWLNDPAVNEGTEARYEPHEIDGVRDYVADAVSSPSTLMWRIMTEEHGHVGNIRLSAIHKHHRRSRIALLIGEKDLWGKGIGSRAIDCLSRHAFEHLNLRKLTAAIYANNAGSRRAFEKAGYSLEATLKEQAIVAGETVDILLLTRFAETETA